MKTLSPFLIAWALYGGGAGCNSPPPTTAVQVPFYCTGLSGTYHWAERFGETFAFTENGVRDCEWNGTDDAGPLDVDESDPLDPHATWDYHIDGDGTYVSQNWVLDCPDGVVCATWEWPRFNFPVEAGATYTMPVTIPNFGTTQVDFDVKCGGMFIADWYSWVDTEPMAWTAVADADCQLEAFVGCEILGPFAALQCPAQFRGMKQ